MLDYRFYWLLTYQIKATSAKIVFNETNFQSCARR